MEYAKFDNADLRNSIFYKTFLSQKHVPERANLNNTSFNEANLSKAIFKKAQLKNGIVIDINTKGIGMSQFEKAENAIKRGHEEAKRYRKELKNYC